MLSPLHKALGFLWGLAEATVFFIVPDVVLSWFALQGLRRALVACLFALLGAVVGGSVTWLVASNEPDALRSIFVSLPAIDIAMITDVRRQLQTDGLMAVFFGPLTGTPYKIYALEAADLKLNYAVFLLISIPARLIRFVLVTSLVAGLNRLLEGRLSLSSRRASLLVCWAAFYAWYFHLMGAAQAGGLS